MIVRCCNLKLTPAVDLPARLVHRLHAQRLATTITRKTPQMVCPVRRQHLFSGENFLAAPLTPFRGAALAAVVVVAAVVVGARLEEQHLLLALAASDRVVDARRLLPDGTRRLLTVPPPVLGAALRTRTTRAALSRRVVQRLGGPRAAVDALEAVVLALAAAASVSGVATGRDAAAGVDVAGSAVILQEG
jgi:hypothetical protein